MSLKCILVFVLTFVLSQNGFTQSMLVKVKTISLGEDSVQLKMYSKSGKSYAYVHVHENETASLEAGLKIVEKFGGKLVTLIHSFDGTKNRNVQFKYQKTTYAFDPNRIYTIDENVLKNSIQVVKGHGEVTSEVISQVKNLANVIWNEAVGFHLIIALHNNKNMPAEYKSKWLFWKSIEPESYNVTSYVKKYDIANSSNSSCSEIYINPKINNSEFFIVTQKQDFNMFTAKKFSVVLQNESPVDDGSMSVYAAKNNKRYINAEAKQGRIAEQIKMLALVNE